MVQQKKALIFNKRLDQAFADGMWWINFPDVTVLHLLAINSDHDPILLNLEKSRRKRRREPFWFEALWPTHVSFQEVSSTTWNAEAHKNLAGKISGYKQII